MSLRIDAQGKTLSHALLTMKVTVPQALVKAAERGDAEDGKVAKADPPPAEPPARTRGDSAAGTRRAKHSSGGRRR